MNAHLNEIVSYYDQLAPGYDASRFANSYGRSIDLEERAILRAWLRPVANGAVLDLGCGTGRLLDMATEGIDPSGEMAAVARGKHPGRRVRQGKLTDLLTTGERFDAIFSLHVMMHLPVEEIASIIASAADIIRPGGLFIFDAPSSLRRRLTGHRQAGWHGGTALNAADVSALAGAGWRLAARRGILLLPLHRVPEALRPAARWLDRVLLSGPLKSLASYTFYCLERR